MFQPHAHVERDLFVQMLDSYRKRFQLTRSRGRDHKTQHFLRSITIFAHAHVERDLAELAGVEYEEISTHTLVERDLQGSSQVFVVFISAHAHVERDIPVVTLQPSTIFQLTLTWSVTIFLWNADETKFHFNSHAHVERDERL